MGRFDPTDAERALIAPPLPGGDGPPRVGRPTPRRPARAGRDLPRPAHRRRPWRGPPPRYGPRTAACNRFNRRAGAGVWARVFAALAARSPGSLRLVDAPAVRAHRHAAGGKGGRGPTESGARTRGGPATKLHALADAFGLPVALAVAPGRAADDRGLRLLIGGVPEGGHLVGGRGRDAARARGLVRDAGAAPRIPSLANRAVREGAGPGVYRARDAVERPINRLKRSRRVATRHGKAARNYLATATLAAIRLWTRFEATT